MLVMHLFTWENGKVDVKNINVNVNAICFRDEFHFSKVYRGVNCTGSHAKLMSPEGVHVNFASNPM